MRKGILILLLLNVTLTALATRNDLALYAREHPKNVNTLSVQASGARPLRTMASNRVADARQIDLLSFDFQQIYYGFEGPNYAPLKGEPPAGAAHPTRR
jgi:hypothetical protein